MASGGILAVDEIGQIREEDKSALHEVMEQGTVSIAKAGIVSKLQADCGLLLQVTQKLDTLTDTLRFLNKLGFLLHYGLVLILFLLCWMILILKLIGRFQSISF